MLYGNGRHQQSNLNFESEPPLIYTSLMKNYISTWPGCETCEIKTEPLIHLWETINELKVDNETLKRSLGLHLCTGWPVHQLKKLKTISNCPC